jgi:hypothetical protein
MPLDQVLPEMTALSPLDKLRLIQILAGELQREDSLIEQGRTYPVWSPDTAFSAADVLLNALQA